jgi:multidrug efflux pump subunit AcrA (membrane-fusion protein)
MQKDFQSGQKIKKGQLLYGIESSKQASQFQQALATYLKSKETLNSDYGKLQSSKNLYQKGLVSKDSFTQAENSYYLSQLSQLQAENQLKESLKYYKFSNNVFSLSLSDIDKISKALSKSFKAELIHVYAPNSGIALLPSSSGSGGSSSSGSSKGVGSQVKRSQVLVNIGLLQGLAITASANEVNVNQLRPGLKASVTSVAFPGITLSGSIVNIAAQATTSGSLPSFKVRIVVPKLTTAQLKVIKIGMSAKATVEIKQKPAIVVPIGAVFEDLKTGKTMVTTIVNGQQKNVPVTVGQTSLGSVVILSGLKTGDEIVTSHQAN